MAYLDLFKTQRYADRAAILFGSLCLTLFVSGVCVAVLGANPFTASRALWFGVFGSSFTIGQTVQIASVLTLSGIASAVPFTAKLWNVGGEGQIYAGATGAISVALLLTDTLPENGYSDVIIGIAAIFAGIIAGVVWAAIPAVLKAWLDASEMIVSLLLNFIAIMLTRYVIHSVFPDSTGQTTLAISDSARFVSFFGIPGINLSVIIAVLVVILVGILMKYTAVGFAIRAVGLSPAAAKLAGFSTNQTTFVTFALAGAAAGLAGALLIVGGIGQLSLGISANYGFLGIAVALVAGLRILWLPFAALLFAALSVGSNSLQVTTGLPHSLGIVVIGVLILSLLATSIIGVRRMGR
jgi:general nucleoside transport system permease protein